jgi:hypothetical protein
MFSILLSPLSYDKLLTFVCYKICEDQEIDLVEIKKLVVYYQSTKRKLNKRLILECRCDERLKAKAEGSTRLAYLHWRKQGENKKLAIASWVKMGIVSGQRRWALRKLWKRWTDNNRLSSWLRSVMTRTKLLKRLQTISMYICCSCVCACVAGVALPKVWALCKLWKRWTDVQGPSSWTGLFKSYIYIVCVCVCVCESVCGGEVVCMRGVCVLCVYKCVRASVQVWKRGVCARTCVSRVRVHLHMCADAQSLSVLVNCWRGRRYTVIHFKAIALPRKGKRETIWTPQFWYFFFNHLAHFE